MFLGIAQNDDGWTFTYEPESCEFESGLDGAKPGMNERELHRKYTRPSSGKLTSGSRGGTEDIAMEPADSNNDRARAGRYLEPGVYEIYVSKSEVDEYRTSTVEVLAFSPSYADVMSRDDPRTIASEVAMSKMVWLVRYLDPNHHIDTYPPGVKLAMSNLRALQEERSELRRESSRSLDDLMTMAMGPDWKEKLESNQGSPIKPTRVLPDS